MRTRWDEVDEMENGASRFLGFGAITWAMAVPVAFIAGAAVMSFFGQSPLSQGSLAIPAPTASEPARATTEGRTAAQNGRWEEEARLAAAKAAELQMQVEALRDQVNDESRRRAQAEQSAAQTATALERLQEAETATQQRAATAMTVSNPVQPQQDALSYTAPSSSTSAPAFATQTTGVSEASGSQPAASANDDSIALQRIIEDTASRSAALSDRREEMESDATSSVSNMRSANTPRRVSDVDSALEKATGLDGLSISQRTGLKEELVAGACVTVSLEKVFGNPVPVVPLRNLVRDLDSDC